MQSIVLNNSLLTWLRRVLKESNENHISCFYILLFNNSVHKLEPFFLNHPRNIAKMEKKCMDLLWLQYWWWPCYCMVLTSDCSVKLMLTFLIWGTTTTTNNLQQLQLQGHKIPLVYSFYWDLVPFEPTLLQMLICGS